VPSQEVLAALSKRAAGDPAFSAHYHQLCAHAASQSPSTYWRMICDLAARHAGTNM
jgi:hypothetical protein